MSVTSNEDFFDLEGLEEEGDVTINVEEVNFEEDAKYYTDEKLCNEINNLVKTKFTNIKQYKNYFKNVIDAFKESIKLRYASGDESLYSLLDRNMYPLLNVKPIKVVDDDVGDLEDIEILEKYLQERQTIIASSDSPLVTEARLLNHAKPYIVTNSDRQQLFEKDTECYILNENNIPTMKLKLLGSTNWGDISIHKGEEAEFNGFFYKGKIDKNMEDIQVFYFDDYMENIKSLKKGDLVKVHFNIAKSIAGTTTYYTAGTISSINFYEIIITCEKENTLKFHYCTTDLTVNDCFIYGEKYVGEYYSKNNLFNENWTFIVKKGKISIDNMQKTIFPNLLEGLKIFQQTNIITNFSQIYDILGYYPVGHDNSHFISKMISNNITSIIKKQGKKTFKPIKMPKYIDKIVDFLMFEKYSKVLHKFYDNYVVHSKVSDTNISRFSYITGNIHNMNAYMLTLLRKQYPSFVQSLAPKKNKTTLKQVENNTKANHEVNNIQELYYMKAEKGEIVFVKSNNRVYKRRSNYWKLYNDVSPYEIQLNNVKYYDNQLYTTTYEKYQTFAKNFNNKYYKDLIDVDIETHKLLGSYNAYRNKSSEYTYHKKINYDILQGKDQTNDYEEDFLNNPEFSANYYEYVEENENKMEEVTTKLMDEPVGVVLLMFIELFKIKIDPKNVSIILYNISKYNDFKDINKALLDKEKELNIQVQRQLKSKSMDRNKLNELIKKRLQSVEKEFMSKYYAETILMTISFLTLYVHMCLPKVNISPLNIGNCSNKFSYTGYPINKSPKSLINYLSCITIELSKGNSNIEGNPLGIAYSKLKEIDIEKGVREHIDKVLLEKPHYKKIIENNKEKLETNSNTKKDNIFYGFRPDWNVTKPESFPNNNIGDFVIGNASIHPNVKACCVTVLTDINRSNNRPTFTDFSTQHFQFLKEKPMNTHQSINVMINHSNHKFINISNVDNTTMKFEEYITFFCANNDFFKDDPLLTDIGDNTDKWNELSSHVTIKWEKLSNLLKVQDDKWHELFIKQERFNNEHELRRQFEKVMRYTLPVLFGRCVNGYLIDTRYIESKKYINIEDRQNIISNISNKETEHLVELTSKYNDNTLQENIKYLLEESFNNINICFTFNKDQSFRVNLFYNYLILKLMYAIMNGYQIIDKENVFNMHFNSKNEKMKQLGDMVTMILNKVYTMIDFNSLDIERLQTEFEKQKESVKQEVARKLEKFNQDDKNLIRFIKEKTGIDMAYMKDNETENIQEHNTDTDANDDIILEWVGENPDDDEIYDDGSGY